MVNFGAALRNGLRFSIEPKRWLPLFVMDAVGLGIIIFTLLINTGGIMDILMEVDGNPLAAAQVASIILWLLIGIFLWYLARMWILGSLIHQSFRPREFNKAYRLSMNRLHKLVISAIMVGAVSGLISNIPAVGGVLGIVAGLVFFFVFQGIILDNLGAVSAIKNSWKMFRKNPFDVFVSWFLIAIVSTLIIGLFSIPLIASFFGLFLGTVTTGGAMDAGTMALLFVYLQENTAQIFVLGLIAIFGMEISQVFSIRAQTDIYIQMKKKFPSIIKAFAKRVGKFF